MFKAFISEVLSMTVDEAVAYSRIVPHSSKLSDIQDAGLGYILSARSALT
jgi:excinuclease UvrABC ATPase subunit